MQKPHDIATRTSWETHLIDQPKKIDIDLQFTIEQVAQMKKRVYSTTNGR